MRVSVRGIGFTVGALALVLVLVGIGFAGGQRVSAQGPGFGHGGPGGRFGGPEGPGGPGGPGGGMGRRGPGGPGGPMGPGGAAGGLGPMMLGQLDLSQDQRDRVKQILDSHKDEQKALGDRAMAAHEALDDAVASGTPDEALVRTRAEAVSTVGVDQMVFHARIYAEVFQILTADQQTKLKTMQAEMKTRREQMKAQRDKRTGGAGF